MKKVIVFLAMILLLMSVSFASLSVESFTCNSQSGTISVENNAAMICQAVVANDDTQNSASLSTVTLYVDGTWAEDASYLGSGFSTSINQGGSTTVTFSGIRPVTPGSTHKFQSILLDSTTDTTASNSVVNVVAFKQLTSSAPASAMSVGDQFEVSSYVMTGGSLDNVDLSIGLIGCSVASGESVTKSIGAMGNNAESSRSWQVVQALGTCTATVTATGTAGQAVTIREKAASILGPTTTTILSSSSGSSGSGSGSGGGGGGSSSAKVSKLWITMPTEATMIVNSTLIPITKLIISLNQELSGTSISVESFSTNPLTSAPTGKVYKYLDIQKTNITDDDVKSVAITFKVPKSWISSNSADTNNLKLYRYTTQWVELSTRKLSESSIDVIYEATSPGLSYFAIADNTVPPEQAVDTIDNQEGKKEESIIDAIIPDTIEEAGWFALFLIIIIVVILVVIYEVFMRKTNPSHWNIPKSENKPKKIKVKKA